MRSFKTTLSCLKYTTNWSSMINEFCSHDKTLISFEIFLFLVHSDRSFLCDVCLICCELFKSGLIFKIMYKKQQQFVSCTICDHDEMKCYWSPMVDMTARALHPNMLVYNNTIVKDDSTQKQATDSSFLRRYSWGSISSIYYSIFKVKEMYEWSGSRNHWIAIKMSTMRKIKVKNIRCPLS